MCVLPLNISVHRAGPRVRSVCVCACVPFVTFVFMLVSSRLESSVSFKQLARTPHVYFTTTPHAYTHTHTHTLRLLSLLASSLSPWDREPASDLGPPPNSHQHNVDSPPALHYNAVRVCCRKYYLRVHLSHPLPLTHFACIMQNTCLSYGLGLEYKHISARCTSVSACTEMVRPGGASGCTRHRRANLR